MTTTSLPLSTLGAREDLSRGFGKAGPAPAGAVLLHGGAPSQDLLPLQAIARATAELAADPAALTGALQYSVPAGRDALRAWIAHREGVDPDRVLVTNGAFHGLSLLFDALLDRGDQVAIEDPTYPLIFRDLQHHEPEILPLPVTDTGPDVESLASRLEAGARPRLLYTVPDFHNPTGLITPVEDRHRLVDLAERYGFVIVSDNAYHGLAFPDVDVPEDYPLSSEHVVHVRTFSKILGPGLRLGWMVLPTWLVPPVTRLRANHDQHSSVLVQEIVSRIIGAGGLEPIEGGFDGFATRAREAYAERFDLVTGILEDQVPGGVEVRHRTGGIFAWVRVRDAGIDLAAAQRLARTRYGTDAVLGRYFGRERPQDDDGHLRLGISHLPPEDLRVGAERLAAALADPAARR